jgi:hypothetical protein
LQNARRAREEIGVQLYSAQQEFAKIHSLLQAAEEKLKQNQMATAEAQQQLQVFLLGEGEV